MEKIKMLRHGDIIPCWYELSWQKDPPAIILRAHKDFAKAQPVLAKDMPLINQFLGNFKFSSFAGDLTKDFGFDKAFVFKGENGEFIEFAIPAPIVSKRTDKPCHYCKGSGKDSYLERKCISCSGTGKEYTVDWKPAYAVSASLYAFLSLAFYPDSETSSPLPQLMSVQVVTDRNSGGLGGEFSLPFCRWLKTLEEGMRFPEVIEEMKSCYKAMFGKADEREGLGFRAWVLRRGEISIDVPGNACGITNSCLSSYPDDKGSEFSCHNVDTPMQQFALLAGLAVLHDRARKEINPASFVQTKGAG